MSSKESTSKDIFRFILLSICSAVLFFVPVHGGQVPIVLLIGGIRTLLGDFSLSIPVISCTFLLVAMAGAKWLHISRLKGFFAGDGLIKHIFFIASALIVYLVVLHADIFFVQHPQIGGRILEISSGIFITIATAGTLVCFLLCSGIVEFAAVIFEPIMRPLYKLPGEAAVNIIAAFVSSASVGIYFTEQHFLKKTYSARQACGIAGNFTIVSVGYISVLASLAGISHRYGTLLLSSFLLVLIIALITIRIPPLSLVPDVCFDGSAPKAVLEKMSVSQRFSLALAQGRQKSREFTFSRFLFNFIQAMKFAVKILGVMIPTITLVFILVYYTPIFQWLGTPMTPMIRLLGIPDAELIAPSTLIGIVEVTLPSILISGSGVSEASAFFVVLLSIVQLVFFTEMGNATISSKIPLDVGKLIVLFFVRTAIGMPLVALVTHLLY